MRKFLRSQLEALFHFVGSSTEKELLVFLQRSGCMRGAKRRSLTRCPISLLIEKQISELDEIWVGTNSAKVTRGKYTVEVQLPQVLRDFIEHFDCGHYSWPYEKTYGRKLKDAAPKRKSAKK